jgi:hypothetical protein
MKAKIYDTSIPVIMGDNITPVDYVNALPGAGKTYQFIKAAVRHVRDKHNSVLVYAAPTDKLLQQVARDLVLGAAVPPSKIRKITSNGTSGRVADRFHSALLGDKAVADGTILLVTHECIAKVPHLMRGKRRVTLVYDEARACLQDNYSLRLPDDVYDFFLNHHLAHDMRDGRKFKGALIQPVVGLEVGEGSTLEVWKWTNPGVAFPDVLFIESLLPESSQKRIQAKRIHEFLENVHSSSIDVYVSVTKKQNKPYYEVNNVFSPTRMFYGYGKVLILSAFFEDSQMYHFLTNPFVDAEFPVKLTHQDHYIDPKRMKQIINRLKNVHLTYIFDLGSRELTKTEMVEGLVSYGQLNQKVTQQLAKDWKEAFGKNKVSSYRSIYKEYESSATDIVSQFSNQDLSKQFKLLEKYKFVDTIRNSSIVRYMVERSLEIQRAWFKNNGLPVEALLTGINATFRNRSNPKIIHSLWETEDIESINMLTNIYKPDVDKKIIVELPMVSHGINAYENYHSAAFLATMKYNPSETGFLRSSVPSYNPAIDRTIDYALQVLFRCNVRVADSKDPCLLIVTDKAIAEALHKRFQSILPKTEPLKARVLSIVSPELIVRNWKFDSILSYSTPYDKKAQKQANNKYHATDKGQLTKELKKLYESSDAGRAYIAITMKISRYKKQDKDVTSLLAERLQLMSVAQWKKSDEGIEAFRKLTAPVKSTEQKLLTVLNDSRFWDSKDRGERLPHVLAAKCAGIQRESITVYPSTDGYPPVKNWNNKEWNGHCTPAQFILARAKSLGIRF